MISASQNAQDKPAVYTHSDHVWGSSSVGDEAMRLSTQRNAATLGMLMVSGGALLFIRRKLSI
jgi:LPXTG-motif cell wall-anchored protein